MTENVELEPDESASMQEVVIKAKLRDRAEEIIKKILFVIRKRCWTPSVLYSCKHTLKLFSWIRTTRNQKMIQVAGLILIKCRCAEIVLHVDRNTNGQIKEEKVAGIKGEAQKVSFTSVLLTATFIYDNLIKAPPVSRIPFVSPLSYSGLLAYKFKTSRLTVPSNLRCTPLLSAKTTE